MVVINWLYLTIFLLWKVSLSDLLHWVIITTSLKTSLTTSLGVGSTVYFGFTGESAPTDDLGGLYNFSGTYNPSYITWAAVETTVSDDW